MATNVKGNWKEGFKKTAKQGWKKTKKISKHAAKDFKTYAGPTIGMFRKTGSAALGTGKFLIKRGALGFPGLIATGAYYGAKKIINKGEKIASRPMSKQWKRKPFGKTGWTI
tara:strand:+ start:693 stop:1028 length:336 start_codon:yes stop_codon:yes gene_type:complete